MARVKMIWGWPIWLPPLLSWSDHWLLKLGLATTPPTVEKEPIRMVRPCRLLDHISFRDALGGLLDELVAVGVETLVSEWNFAINSIAPKCPIHLRTHPPPHGSPGCCKLWNKLGEGWGASGGKLPQMILGLRLDTSLVTIVMPSSLLRKLRLWDGSVRPLISKCNSIEC